MRKLFTFRCLLLSIILFVSILPKSGLGQIAAWDFTGENQLSTSTADLFNANLDAAPILTRGSGAAASAGANSFRTVGFQNNGVSTANTDYFQFTISSNTGYTLSLSTIDAKFNGTASYFVSPGVTSQFAYSLDGTNFTLIGSPVISTSLTMATLNLTGISALQNLPASATVTFRYYASGQTTTGGWGFFSSAAGIYGLAIGGTVNAINSTPTVSLSVSSNSGNETTATAITVTATASQAVTGDQTVTLGVSGTNITTGDYTLNGNTTNNVTITILNGATTGTATFTVVDDALLEGTETATLAISSPSAGITLGSTVSQDIVITDNDSPPSVDLSVSSSTGTEAGATAITVTATSSLPVIGDQTVTLTVTGTNITIGDYSLNGSATNTATITIPNGATTGTATFTVVDDALLEGSETATLTISNPSAGVTLGSTKTQNITILDNEIPKIVINQVYGGGGNSGAIYKNDFIELYNNENIAIDLSGWSVQYSSAAGTTWQVTNLSGSVPSHSFFLVQESQGAGGTLNLPTPDAVGTILMSATAGKIILSNSTTALTGANPTGSVVIDKVGYAPTATGFETAPTDAPDNTTSVKRITDGVDNGNNSTDFVVGDPIPRNKTYTTAAPLIISVTPPDNSSDVPYNVAPAITFDKPIQKGTGSITIFENGVGTAINVTSSNVVISNNSVVTINTPLSGGKSYSIQVDAGAFKDVYGNNFTGINDNTTWNFTTYNSSVPVSLPATFDFNNCSGSGLLPNGFTQYSVAGPQVWDCTTFGRNPADLSGTGPFGNAVQINGFAGTNIPNIDWLISPSQDLTGSTYPLLSFWTRNAFNGAPLQLKVSTDYVTGDPASATWTDLNGKFPAQATNIWTLSSNINLSAYKQSNVHFALVYTSSDEDGARWTVDDIAVINSTTPPPPSLTVGTTDIQYTFAASGSSADKTFTFIGNDLTGDVTLTSTGAFLLSKDGTAFSSSINYTSAEANNILETVHVRFAPTQANQNFTGTITVTTSDLTGTINLKGTSIDPATTLEVVNWNMEWFGSTDPSLGPTNDNLQQQNAETVLTTIGADVYGLVEVVDEARLAAIVSHMPGYSYIICNYGSHVNPPEAGGGPLSGAQKEAFVYKTSLLSNITTRPLINQPPGSTSYNSWSSGRYPFLMTADVTLNCVTKTINFVLIHAKANTSPTATAYARRQAGANELHDTLLLPNFANANIIMLGDFNDDLDQTITAGITPNTTSYSAFTTDNANFFSPTLALSLAGKRSTVTFNDVIDHVMLSNEMQPYYMPATANILTDVASLIPNYGSTTTDHYPVFTRYIFPNTTPPSVISCTASVTYCANPSATYTVPAFTATDDCGDVITYSYEITGATERTGTTSDASGNFNVGISTIVWTAKDGWGNATTCSTTVTVNPLPTVSFDLTDNSVHHLNNINNTEADPSESASIAVCDGGTYTLSNLVNSSPLNRYKVEIISTSGGGLLFNGNPTSGGDISTAQFSGAQATLTITLSDPDMGGTLVQKITPYSDANGNGANDPEECLGDPITITYSATPKNTYYVDNDGDGFGDLNHPLRACSQPAGYVTNSSDCDDTKTTYADNDGDGYGAGPKTACGVDNNADCDDDNDDINPETIWFQDADGDGFGNNNVTKTQCIKPVGYVDNNYDCDDTKTAKKEEDEMVVMCHDGKAECVKVKDVQKHLDEKNSKWILGPCTSPCKGDEVQMCHDGKIHCVKQKDVQKKLNEKGHKWTLGPCTQASCESDQTLMCHNGLPECVKNKDVDKRLKEKGDHWTASCVAYVQSRIAGTTSVSTDQPAKSNIGLYNLSNYPNPFNTSTIISYYVPVDSKVSLKIYNALGQAVTTLFDGDKKAGSYTVTFNASKLTNGFYYCKLVALANKQQFVQSIKLAVGK